MGVLDTVARNLTSTMVGKFGQTVKLRERQGGEYDTTNLTVSVAKFEHDVSALVQEYSQGEIKGLVKSGDKKVVVAAKDLPRIPNVEWKVRIGDTWYEIRHVKSMYSGDEAMSHEIVARGP